MDEKLFTVALTRDELDAVVNHGMTDEFLDPQHRSHYYAGLEKLKVALKDAEDPEGLNGVEQGDYPAGYVHALPLGPDACVVPDKIGVERGIHASNPNMEAVVLAFVLRGGHEIRFAMAAPNAESTGEKLIDNAKQCKSFAR